MQKTIDQNILIEEFPPSEAEEENILSLNKTFVDIVNKKAKMVVDFCDKIEYFLRITASAVNYECFGEEFKLLCKNITQIHEMLEFEIKKTRIAKTVEIKVIIDNENPFLQNYLELFQKKGPLIRKYFGYINEFINQNKYQEFILPNFFNSRRMEKLFDLFQNSSVTLNSICKEYLKLKLHTLGSIMLFVYRRIFNARAALNESSLKRKMKRFSIAAKYSKRNTVLFSGSVSSNTSSNPESPKKKGSMFQASKTPAEDGYY